MANSSDVIFIVGHKNPDTDSICSAIAYADIKNRTDKKIYVARRAGQINQETEYVLKRFKKQPPRYITNLGTQVRDMDIHLLPEAYSFFSIKNAWDMMKENNIGTLPIQDKEDKLEGLITIGDIAKTFMEDSDNRMLSKARTQYRRMAETINGTIVTGNEHAYFVKGKVTVAAANPQSLQEYIEQDDLVIMGNREDEYQDVIKMGASCIVICLGTSISDEIKELAAQNDVVIILTPFDTYTVARLINQSIPVRYIMKREGLVTFSTEQYTDDIKDIMVNHRHRAFPVINQWGKCIGTISRRNFLGMKKKQVILVDHNEQNQAVDSIEQAKILEIIDHHRIGDLQTLQPVLFRNQPVGCTATIMYQMYHEKQLDIPKDIAGLLCAAIISDTLLFRSPTSTKYDKEAATELAKLAEIETEAFASEMFRAGGNLDAKTPEEIFYQDYKKFMAESLTFGVGQISSMDRESLNSVKERLLPFMKTECGRHNVTQVYFMLTDIINKSTELLCYGKDSENVVRKAFHKEVEQGSCMLAGVVSRKKQLIPALMQAAQEMLP